MLNQKVMKIEKQILHTCFYKAKECISFSKMDEARNYLDNMIGYIAAKRNEGYDANDKIEGVKVDLWLERAWCTLENNNLLL
jgi:hypothetical protein